MKKTAIAIWGNANQGKSSAIREIVNRISIHFPKARIDFRIKGPIDIQAIVTIGELKIGIESQGDPNSRLEESLNIFVKEGCEIIICSTRTRGSTVWLVEELSTKSKYEIIWTSNYYSGEKNKEPLNQLFADHIAKLIGEIIEKKL